MLRRVDPFCEQVPPECNLGLTVLGLGLVEKESCGLREDVME